MIAEKRHRNYRFYFILPDPVATNTFSPTFYAFVYSQPYFAEWLMLYPEFRKFIGSQTPTLIILKIIVNQHSETAKRLICDSFQLFTVVVLGLNQKPYSNEVTYQKCKACY